MTKNIEILLLVHIVQPCDWKTSFLEISTCTTWTYLQVEADWHQDFVGVVSGQQGHEYVLWQKDNNMNDLRRMFFKTPEGAKEVGRAGGGALSPCHFPWRWPERLAPGLRFWFSWSEWRTLLGWQSGRDKHQDIQLETIKSMVRIPMVVQKEMGFILIYLQYIRF